MGYGFEMLVDAVNLGNTKEPPKVLVLRASSVRAKNIRRDLGDRQVDGRL